jgi:hypothetical protein
MQPGTEQPHFIVDEDAAAGAQEAFAHLVALAEEEPDALLAITVTAGTTPAEVIAYASQLQPDDESFTAQSARALSTIFSEQYDRDVQLPGIDSKMRRVMERNQVPAEERRMQRIGLFVGAIGTQARLRATAAARNAA